MKPNGHPIIHNLTRRLPMFVMQMAVIWSHRAAWGILFFIWVLFFTAASFTGTLETSSGFMHTAWIGNFLLLTVSVMIMYIGTRGKYNFFMAHGDGHSWSISQTAAILVTQLPPNLVSWGLFAAFYDEIEISLWNAAASFLFIAVSAGAIFGHLQPRLTSLSPMRQYAVLLLISGPWILTAWLLGLGAAETAAGGHPPIMPLCALCTLYALETALGAACRLTVHKGAPISGKHDK